MAGKRYVKNTVKGSRRGSKWPEEVKTAALCEMLVTNNLAAVAKKVGVPESTLRTWYKEARKLGPGEKKSLFDKQRERELRILQHRAAAGARNSVEYITGRLERGLRDESIQEEAGAELDELRLAVLEGRDDEETEARLTFLRGRLADHRGLSDFAAANYLRALTSVTDKARQLLGEDAGDDTIQVILPEDDEDLMG